MAIFIVSQPIKIHTIDLSQVDKRVNALVSVKKRKDNLHVFWVTNQFSFWFFIYFFIFIIIFVFLGGGEMIEEM